jgi:hypothetical protein
MNEDFTKMFVYFPEILQKCFPGVLRFFAKKAQRCKAGRNTNSNPEDFS